MIRRLRIRHRRWIALLAALLPILLYLALRDRPRVPFVREHPAAAAGAAPAGARP